MTPGSGRLRARLEARLGASALDLPATVVAVSRIPYGRPAARTPEGVLAEWRGTCSTKHVLLAALVSEAWPDIDVRLWHRPYRVTPGLAAERWGPRVAATIPDEGLVDVHTYATLGGGDTERVVDVTFPLDGWDGRSDIPLACDDGADQAAGDDPLATKAELVEELCDPAVREPFIVSLSRAPARQGRVARDDGRRLAWCEWGDPGGRPVVLFHGAPGSRLLCPDAAVTAEAGVRLVTFDRPGVGRSDRHFGRQVCDTAADVAALADHLALDRFAVLGVSAGGPHALACAYALGERVSAVSAVSMPGPLDDVPGAWEALGDHMRPTAEMARREPWRATRAVVRYVEPWIERPDTYYRGGPPADRAVLGDPEHRPVLLADVAEALRPGAGGLADDLVAFWRPWGFPLAGVRAGVRLWHGAQDTRGRPDFDHLAATLPGCRPVVWPDQAHLGVFPRWREVLAETY